MEGQLVLVKGILVEEEKLLDQDALPIVANTRVAYEELMWEYEADFAQLKTIYSEKDLPGYTMGQPS